MPLIFLALIALVLSPLTTFAQAGDTSVQAQCFDTLKQNLIETTRFEESLETLSTKSYADIQGDFSKEYKSLSSFEVSTDVAQFSSRLYSFGDQTGYTHPPVSAFPNYTESEVWAEPAKEYVVGEEYITTPDGKKYFLSCYLLYIDSVDPLLVTEDKYAFDAPGISIMKTASDDSYRAWYGENDAFDFNNEPLVIWRKMLIYPKATENSYFSKYTVAPAYPAHVVTSFEILSFFNKPFLKIFDYDTTGEAVTRYYNETDSVSNPTLLDTEDGLEKEILLDPALYPIKLEGTTLLHPLAKYFEGIEAAFPEFASTLSLRGALKYKTYLAFVNDPQPNAEVAAFMGEFSSGNLFDSYYREAVMGEKMSPSLVPNPELERLLPLVQNADWTIAKLMEGASLSSLVYTSEVVVVEEMPMTQSQGDDNKKLIFIVTLLIAGTLVVLLLGVIKKRIAHAAEVTNE